MERKRLLLAEDEAELVAALKRNLEAHGFEVLTATDGYHALEMVRKGQPHLVLLDLMLPLVDGYRVLKLLKSDLRFKTIPILVITARGSAADLTMALECGADSLLPKPFKFEALLCLIRDLLANGNSEEHKK